MLRHLVFQIAILAFVVGTFGVSASAQEGSDNTNPLHIVADKTRWNLKDRETILEGNVKWSREFVTEDEDGNEATGTYVLNADKVVYDMEEEIAEAEGSVYMTDGQTIINSNQALYDEGRGRAVFTGDVVIRRGPEDRQSVWKLQILYATFDETGGIAELSTDKPSEAFIYTDQEDAGMDFFGGGGSDRNTESVPLKPSE